MGQLPSREATLHASTRLRRLAIKKKQIDIYSGTVITGGVLGLIIINKDGDVQVDRSAIGGQMTRAEFDWYGFDDLLDLA